MAITFTVGVGLTVIVKLIGVPPQAPGAVGVTVIVPLIGAAVPLVAVKLAILPVPLAANPIAGLLFVQLNVVPATALVKFTGNVAAPLHSVWLPTPFTVAVGLTVIVNVIGVPVQVTPALVYTGVTVTVAVTGEDVLLIAVNDAIFPDPDADNPIDGSLLSQLYTVPATGPVIAIAAVVAPEHTVWLAIAFTDGVGLTVIVKLNGTPTQVVSVLIGVTVIVATTDAVPKLVAVKLGIFPVPAIPKPIDGWLFVQLKNTPGIGVTKFTAVVGEPLHNTWLPGVGDVATGVGFTVIVKLITGPTQLTPPLVNVGVTVIVAVIATNVKFIAVNAGILPLPLAANPMPGWLFVHAYVTVPPVLGVVKLIAACVAPLHTV